MSKKPLIGVVVGLNKEASAAEMSTALDSLLQEVIKPVMIKIDADSESIKRVTNQLKEIKNLMDSVSTGNMSGMQQPTPKGGVIESAFSNEDLQNFAKINELQDASIQKISKINDGFEKITFAAKDSTDTVRQFTATFAEGNYEEAVHVTETFFNRAGKEFEKTLQNVKSLDQKIKELSKQRDYFESVGNEDSLIQTEEKLNDLIQKRVVLKSNFTDRLKEAREQGLISSQEQIELGDKLLQIDDKRNASEAALAETAARREINELLKNETQAKTQIAELEKNKGLYTEQEYEAKKKSLEDELSSISNMINSYQDYTNIIKQAREAQDQKSDKIDISARYQEAKQALQELVSAQKQLNNLEKEHIKTQHRSSSETNQKRIQEISELRNRVQDLTTNLKSLEGFETSKIQEEFKKFTDQVQTSENGLARLQASYKTLDEQIGKLATSQSGDAVIIPEDAVHSGVQALQKYATELEGIEVQISKLKTSTRGYADITHEFTTKQELAGGIVKETSYAYDAHHQQARKIGESYRLNAHRMLSWSDQVSVAIKRMFAWGIAAQALYGSLRKIREGFSFIAELDKNLTQVAIVQGNLRESTKYLADEYVSLAKEMKKSVTEISQVNMELIRQGLSVEEATSRMTTILKLSSAAMITTDDALRFITSSVNAMGEEAEKTADVLLKASQVSASTVEGLGLAFTKTASSAYVAGLEIEQVTALLATMKEITQESDTNLGTSLKTILARFNRVNEETGEVNEDLNKVQEAMESVGVRFMETADEIRPVYDILEDLSLIWDDLTGVQQAYIATQAAGVRQQNRFFAIMSNFNRTLEIHNELMGAAGTLNQSYETYLDSVEAAQKRLVVAIEKVWITLIQSDHIKMFYNMSAAAVEFINKIGPLPVILTAVATALLAKSSAYRHVIEGVSNAIPSLLELTSVQEAHTLALQRYEQNKSLANQADLLAAETALTNIQAQIAQATTLEGIVAILKTKIASLVASNALMLTATKLALGLAATVAPFIVFGLVIKGISKLWEVWRDRIVDVNAEMSKFQDLAGQGNSLNALVQEWDVLRSKTEQTEEDLTRISEIQKIIAMSHEDLVDAVDEEGNLIASNLELVREYAELKTQIADQAGAELKSVVEEELESIKIQTEYLQKRIAEQERHIKLRKEEGKSTERLEQNLLKTRQQLAELTKSEIRSKNQLASINRQEAVMEKQAQLQRLQNLDTEIKMQEERVQFFAEGTRRRREEEETLKKLNEQMEDLLKHEELSNMYKEEGADALQKITDIQTIQIENIEDVIEREIEVTQAVKDQYRVKAEMHGMELKHERDLLQTRLKAMEELRAYTIANSVLEKAIEREGVDDLEGLQQAWQDGHQIGSTRFASPFLKSEIDRLNDLIKENDELLDKIDSISVKSPDSSSSAGGKKSGDREDPHESGIDEFHNYLEKIVSLERERAQIQRWMETAREDEKIGLIEQEIEVINRLKSAHEELLEAQETAMQKHVDEKILKGPAAAFLEYNAELNELHINWEKYNAILDTGLESHVELAESIDEIVDKFQEYRDAVSSTKDELGGLTMAQRDHIKDIATREIDRAIRAIDRQIKDIRFNEKQQIRAIKEALEAQEEYYNNLIEAKKEQIKLLDQQIEREDRLATLKEKTDELTKLQTDRRYTYINEVGKQVFTFDQMQYAKIWREREELIRKYKNDDLKNALNREIKDLEAARDRKKEIAKEKEDNLKQANEREIYELNKHKDRLREIRAMGLEDMLEALQEFEGMFEGFADNIAGIIADLVARIQALMAQLRAQQQRGGGDVPYSNPQTSEERYANFAHVGGQAAVDRANQLGINSSNMPGLSASEYNALISTPGLSVYDPKKSYHSGGIVGDESFNPKTEEISKLLKGELVLNKSQLMNIPNIIANLAKSAFPIVQTNESKSDSTEYHFHNVSINTNNAQDFFKQIDHLVMARAR